MHLYIKYIFIIKICNKVTLDSAMSLNRRKIMNAAIAWRQVSLIISIYEHKIKIKKSLYKFNNSNTKVQGSSACKNNLQAKYLLSVTIK